MKNLQTTFAQRIERSNRTFLLQDNEGRVLASDLTSLDAIALLSVLMEHNGISSWTVVTQSIEEDCGRCAETDDDNELN